MASRRAARALTFQLQRAGEPELWVNYAVSAPGQQAERGGAAAWGWGKVTEYAQRQWDAVKQAPEGSLKHRVYKGANWALDRVAPDEVTLRHLANADALVLLVPEGVSPAAAQQRLQRLGAARYSIHNHYLGLSYLALVVTVPSTILPLPSFPLWWNVFRVWGNHRARAGARSLLSTLSQPSGQAAPVERPWPSCRGLAAGECCRVGVAWERAPADANAVVVPCKQLATALGMDAHRGVAAVEAAHARMRCQVVESSLAFPGLGEHAGHFLRHHTLQK